MDTILLKSIIATGVISLFSLVGAFTFSFKTEVIKRLSVYLVAFSTGALLGGAFLHLLPEVVNEDPSLNPYIYLLGGIIVFYMLERFLKWHHCHEEGGDCDVHTFTYMSLIGDGLHNFIDGMIIVSSFFTNPGLGFASTLAVASHEVPQELGDFGVLIHGGFSRKKALLWNFVSALTAILGAIFGYFLISRVTDVSLALLPFAAGGFIYVSMSDLIPELHKENNLSRSIFYFVTFVVGLVFMYGVKVFFE